MIIIPKKFYKRNQQSDHWKTRNWRLETREKRRTFDEFTPWGLRQVGRYDPYRHGRLPEAPVSPDHYGWVARTNLVCPWPRSLDRAVHQEQIRICPSHPSPACRIPIGGFRNRLYRRRRLQSEYTSIPKGTNIWVICEIYGSIPSLTVNGEP